MADLEVLHGGLKAEGLILSFGKKRALDQFSVNVSANYNVLGILGRNGAGKTTFLRALVGHLTPQSGLLSITIHEKRARQLSPTAAVYIPEISRPIQALRGTDYLDFHAALDRSIGVNTDVQLRDELVIQLGIGEAAKQRFAEMSKGTRRKFELAAAMASVTPFLVADEITDGLDVPSMTAVADAVRSVQGRRYIISSHDLAFITAVADTIIVIDQGKCIRLFENVASNEIIQAELRESFKSPPSEPSVFMSE